MAAAGRAVQVAMTKDLILKQVFENLPLDRALLDRPWVFRGATNNQAERVHWLCNCSLTPALHDPKEVLPKFQCLPNPIIADGQILVLDRGERLVFYFGQCPRCEKVYWSYFPLVGVFA